MKTIYSHAAYDGAIRHYKDRKIAIGSSDIAALVMDGASTEPARLKFGQDGNYSAYLVTDAGMIPDFYSRVYETTTWLRMFDDDGQVTEFHAPHISVWAAGSMGCIVCMEEESK